MAFSSWSYFNQGRPSHHFALKIRLGIFSCSYLNLFSAFVALSLVTYVLSLMTCACLFNPGRAPFINFMGHNISLKLVGHTGKILRYKSSSVPSFHEKYSSRENKHFKSLSVNWNNQNSKRVKRGEVNKQSVTKIESLFLEIDVITFKQFPLVGTSFKFYIW
jgi:hypothetical protein